MSNLTPGQLERKRANDREAQRAIRARTKETIERLQQENKMLQGEKQALQDEVNRLKDTGPHYPGNSEYYGTRPFTTRPKLQRTHLTTLCFSGFGPWQSDAGAGLCFGCE